MNKPELREWLNENKSRTVNDYYEKFGIQKSALTKFPKVSLAQKKKNSTTWIYFTAIIFVILVVPFFISNKQVTPSKIVNIPTDNSVKQKEQFKDNLAGHVYIAKNDNIIYSLKFLESNEVIVSIFNIGIFQQTYTVIDSIIDIKLWKDPLQYKILNGIQLKLIRSPLKYNKSSIMELRK